jgi:hypothetical protein
MVGSEEYDVVVEKLRAAAPVINAFQSESVQLRVVDALIVAMGEPLTSKPSGQQGDGEQGRADRARRALKRVAKPPGAEGADRPAKKKAAKGGFALVNTLDLHPKGKESLEDFIADVAPKSHVENCVAATYYLEHVIEEVPVTQNMIFTIYRVLKWTLPKDLSNTLSQAGSKGLIDQSDRSKIAVTLPGLNLVEKTMRGRGKKA